MTQPPMLGHLGAIVPASGSRPLSSAPRPFERRNGTMTTSMELREIATARGLT